MDYYQQLSPMCNLEQDWYGNPATSFDDVQPKMENDFGNPSFSSNYTPEYQEQQVPYAQQTAAGPIRRVRTNLTPTDGRTSSPKIGRPPKSGSTTKMASYARSYRAHKKEEVKKLIQENSELAEENQRLEIQNKALQAHLRNLEKEMMSLRSVMNKDSQIAAIVASLGGGAPNPNPTEGGVCLHLSGGRVQIEVCQTCNNRVRDRALACRQSREDPLLCQSSSDNLTDFY